VIPRSGSINYSKANIDNNISLNNEQLQLNVGNHKAGRLPTRGQEKGVNESLNHQISLKNEAANYIYNTSAMH